MYIIRIKKRRRRMEPYIIIKCKQVNERKRKTCVMYISCVKQIIHSLIRLLASNNTLQHNIENSLHPKSLYDDGVRHSNVRSFHSHMKIQWKLFVFTKQLNTCIPIHNQCSSRKPSTSCEAVFCLCVCRSHYFLNKLHALKYNAYCCYVNRTINLQNYSHVKKIGAESV